LTDISEGDKVDYKYIRSNKEANDMKIREMRIYKALSEISKPIADATHDISEIAFYVVEVESMDGVIGQGYLLSFHYSPNGIEGVLKDIKKFIESRNYSIFQTQDIQHDYENESEYFGITGLQRWALAALNIALWDAYARTLKQPIWKLFGCHTRKIPVYGSGGWISYSEKELVEEVADYKRRGFQAVKIKVGSPEMNQDMERLTKVREAVGNDLKIMMDANQGMDVTSAVKLANSVEHLNIHWFEEPVVNTDFEGYAAIRTKTRVSLAMGEREYNTVALRELIMRRALDLWQPDIIRLGGVEEWTRSAALANAFHIPVLPHYYKDYDVPLLASVRNPYGAESFDWIDGIIDNKMVIDNGYARPREGAGWGFNFLHQYLEEV